MGVFQNEWRAIGVQQSRGWVHYAIHRPEPHIMLFRRPLNFQQQQQENQAQGIMAKWKEVSTTVLQVVSKTLEMKPSALLLV